MEDLNLPDVNRVRNSNDKRVLPPQASAEDTSNWDNRAIALPDPRRSEAQFMKDSGLGDNAFMIIENPYLAQEQLSSVKRKK